MKHLFALLTALAVVPSAVAQWTIETYQLQPGWNSIFALNDASHVDLDTLLSAYPDVTQVWRWVPSDLTAQFIANPDEVVEGAEWRTWLRNDPGNSTMNALLPNHGYLIFLAGTTDQTLSIKGKALLSRLEWRSSGANLVGFPTYVSDAPQFGGFLAPFAGFNATTTNIYQYVGGEIADGSNPTRVFNLNGATIQRGKAYWVELATYSDFVSPVKVQVGSESGGLHFGAQGRPQSVRVTNLSDAELTVILAPTASLPAPEGEASVVGQVPLLQRVFNATNQQFEYVSLGDSLTATLEARGSVAWTLVPDRSAMTGVGSLFASVLRVTDHGAHGRYSDLTIPVTAEKKGLDGLWIGEARVTQVQNQLRRFERDAEGDNVIDEDGNYVLLSEENANTATAQPFPLRLIVHVDDGGLARLLSNVYHGVLDTNPPSLGFAVRQHLLRAEDLSSATRVTATHLPLDVNAVLAGAFEPGGQSSTTVTLAYDDPVNPFLHTYHPDHDNLDARFSATPLGAGIESHSVSRSITLTIDASSLDGDPTWGASSLTGTYAELITGLHKESIEVEGSFALRRLSETNVLSQ